MTTTRELVEAVRRGGFDFDIRDGRAHLRPVSKKPHLPREVVDELRERRDEVIYYLREFDLPGERPDTITADPKPAPTTAPPKSAWETCSACKAEVLAAEMPTAMALCDTPSRCPYRPAEVRTATPYVPPSAPNSPSGPARPLLTSKPAPPAPAPELFGP